MLRPCKECELYYFVPPEDRWKTVPCHHIPLNEANDTIDSLEWETDQAGIQEAVEKWLCEAISKLEQQKADGVVTVSSAVEDNVI